ncbi:MAG: IS91 family transposase [Cyclobacteriaceae bacterium]
MKTNNRTQVSLADIFNKYADEFINSHSLCVDQLKAIHAIRSCRTAVLGGHIRQCGQCGHQQNAYNSCRNRHCNKCQYLKQLIWVDKLKSRLPASRYFHVVFTLPSSLHKLIYLNPALCYDLLFKSSAQAVQKAASNPKHLGAYTGAVSVLHSWGQTLTYHPHIHMLVPAGGLSADRAEWIGSRKKFFLPVKVLSRIYRGVFWSMLQSLIDQEKVRLPDGFTKDQIKKLVYQKDWNVYCKKSMASPHAVVQYLGRYTHRVAISNQRILSLKAGKVALSYKNYRTRLSGQIITLDAIEFIGRFVRHILPNGFYKIRYTGLLSCCNAKLIETCKQLLARPSHVSILDGLSAEEVYHVVSGKPSRICGKCRKGAMETISEIPPG